MKNHLYKATSISDFHQLTGLSMPGHPLLSLIDIGTPEYRIEGLSTAVLINFYSICVKRSSGLQLKYGQQQYDFTNGVAFFMSPNQVFSLSADGDELKKASGWLLLIHPDFFWNTHLMKTIGQYEYFEYNINEALWLSEKEEKVINSIITGIHQEYHENIDKFSKSIIVSHIETLLNYFERFYNRQFITREKSNHYILNRLRTLLTDYFSKDDLIFRGLPTVYDLAEKLNISPRYLSGLLKSLTGRNTQQHVHDYLIEKAKEKLSTTDLSISEIAYQLGFKHAQSFNKLFKSKVNQSPLEFRQSFN